ncbi:MAG: hypothetical protein AAF617_14280 [Bacteroidota bacterium]
MKKRNLMALRLNKQSISSFDSYKLNGGTSETADWDSCISCAGPPPKTVIKKSDDCTQVVCVPSVGCTM